MTVMIVVTNFTVVIVVTIVTKVTIAKKVIEVKRDSSDIYSSDNSGSSYRSDCSDFIDISDSTGCIEPGNLVSSPISSPALNLIYARAQAEPISEIPLPSEPEPSSARISNLLSSPNRAGF